MATPWSDQKRMLGKQLLAALYEGRLLRTWLRDRPEGWEIVSGRWSPFYINMRNVPSRPPLFHLVIDAVAGMIQHEVPRADRLVGLAATGVPIAAAVGYAMNLPVAYTRKLPGVRSLKDLEGHTAHDASYGGHALVEGDFAAGDAVVLVDDVVSHFDSKEVAIRQLEIEMRRRNLAGVEVAAVAVLVDRGRTAERRARELGIRFARLVGLEEEGLDMLQDVVGARELEVIRRYVADPDPFQSEAMQRSLREEALARAAHPT